MSVTKEFGARGITPEIVMVPTPQSAFQIQINGESLCRMVSALRQKEGVPDPQMAEKIETYRTSGLCLGVPAADDPFPDDKSEQIGIRAIDMANTIHAKDDKCIETMRAGGVDGDAVRRAFAADIRLCCLGQIKKIHYSILSRCPTARESRGETAYNRFLAFEAPGVYAPPCDVDELAKYLRELGQAMKDIH